MKNSKKEFHLFAKKIIKTAGSILLKNQENIKVINQKDAQDIASNADIASEKYLIDRILSTYPSHNIIAEEYGEINNKSPYSWIIDPLDGTKEYVRGIPFWNCAICLQYEGKTIVSVIYKPFEDEIFSAIEKIGSFKNDKQIHVNNKTKLENSFVYCYLPSYKENQVKFDWSFEVLREIDKKVYRLRSYSHDNIILCWLAQGGCEAFINLINPSPKHDILPGLLIAKEAGAYNIVDRLPLLVTNNRYLYKKLENIINSI